MRVVARVDAFGERIAAAPAGARWAVAYGTLVTLWDGTDRAGELPEASERILDLRFDGDRILAAPLRATGDAWDDLPPLATAVDPWRIVAATWAGERLLVAEGAPAGGDEQHVRLYDGATREPGPVLWADSEWARVEAVAASGARLAAAALEVRVWDAGSLDDVLVVSERGIQVRRVLLAGDDVVVGYADGYVAVHGRGGWRAHEDEARAIEAGAGGHLVTGGGDGRVAIWTPGGELVEEAQLDTPVADVAVGGDGRVLALHQLPDTGVSVLEPG